MYNIKLMTPYIKRITAMSLCNVLLYAKVTDLRPLDMRSSIRALVVTIRNNRRKMTGRYRLTTRLCYVSAIGTQVMN